MVTTLCLTRQNKGQTPTRSHETRPQGQPCAHVGMLQGCFVVGSQVRITTNFSTGVQVDEEVSVTSSCGTTAWRKYESGEPRQAATRQQQAHRRCYRQQVLRVLHRSLVFLPIVPNVVQIQPSGVVPAGSLFAQLAVFSGTTVQPVAHHRHRTSRIMHLPILMP